MANDSKSKKVITDELLDELLNGEAPKEAFLNGGLIDDLKQAIADRVLNAEMDVHLEQDEEQSSGNQPPQRYQPQAGSDGLRLHGRIDSAGPAGSLRSPAHREVPAAIAGIRRQGDRAIFAGNDDAGDPGACAGALWGGRLPGAGLEGHRCRTRRSPGVAVGPLQSVYAIVYFDAVRAKIRDEGLVRNKAVYLAIGITCSGYKDVLGLWIEQTEGAKFWLSVMNGLKARGVTDVLIAVVDGLKGFPEAIESAFPQALVQTCIVYLILIRHSMAYASWKDRKTLAKVLKAIYQAESADAAYAALETFEAGEWGQKYPAIAKSWHRNWEQVIPFFGFSAPI